MYTLVDQTMTCADYPRLCDRAINLGRNDLTETIRRPSIDGPINCPNLICGQSGLPVYSLYISGLKFEFMLRSILSITNTYLTHNNPKPFTEYDYYFYEPIVLSEDIEVNFNSISTASIIRIS